MFFHTTNGFSFIQVSESRLTIEESDLSSRSLFKPKKSMELGSLLVVFIVGVLASFIGAMTGSAGLITIPFLMFWGLPPHIAIATHKLGAAGLKLGAVAKFRKTDFIQWQYILPFSMISIVAALVGAQVLLRIDKEVLSDIVIVLLLIVLPVVFLKKEIGVVHKATSKIKQMIGYVAYFFAQVFGAFFGGGSATIIIYLFISFFGFTIIEASATGMIPSLILNIVALIIFMINGIVDYEVGVSLFFGMMTGGWLGAVVAVKKGNAWVKIIFVIVVIALIIKLLLE